MTLNHLNLVVSNVPDATRLFERFFHFNCIDTKGNNMIAILKGADGFTLVLMAGRAGPPAYPDAFHIGFILADAAAVTECYQSLISGGIPIAREPGKIRETFGFYFTYDHIMIEVAHY